jgi:Flp pilus assembly pilin Flp
MKNLNTFLAKFRKDESGAAMIEYVLIAGLVSVIAIIAITASGQAVNRVWVAVQLALEGVSPPAP